MSKKSQPRPLKPVTEDETCPVCGQFIGDLWECFTVNDEWTIIECPHCEAELHATRIVDVRYQLRPTDD